ncbi:hypothetical protein DT076_06485 [Desertihabitans brevis]|uniref:Uncharacterized protein n=1 Tax=Desertihabitans brevis TaxID=2268447 RepID=A0A367YWV0_9ACTN|nr:hypothetical protein [Desertihabitans brevis]RCK70298.1 hypothetical protein DT076_06485 [Desertihabitans brevis]
MEDTDRCVQWLRELADVLPEDTTGLRRPELLQLLQDLTGTFVELPEEGRRRVSRAMTVPVGSALKVLATHVLEQALDEQRPELLRTAVRAHVVEGFQIEAEDSVRHLAMLAEACRRLDVDLDELVQEVLPVAGDEAREGLTEFTRRPRADRLLTGFGLRLEQGEDGWRFRALRPGRQG